jgi:hypothetical protein
MNKSTLLLALMAMKTIQFLLLAMACSAAIAGEGSTLLPKKLIMTGWDSPDTAQFRRDIRSMEQCIGGQPASATPGLT